MEIHEAIDQISQIRSQMAQTAIFRGYRSLTVGCSALLGVVAATVQACWIPRPTEQLSSYLSLWCGVAVAAVGIVVAEICLREFYSSSWQVRQNSRSALEQFAPCLAAGAVVTVVIQRHAVDAAWMLPGLWAIVFSLGTFASSHMLPRPMLLVGAWYMIGGAAALFLGNSVRPLSPWSMAILFGGGQMFSAIVLYMNIERSSLDSIDDD